ncbi:copper chaperone PCu(A)C [Actibacterium sp.]|uniref:copper chaperone PCu(A)C n=1 Tax=Actibacterium sp. TaxID=1872125 RepID=UPI00356A464B
MSLSKTLFAAIAAVSFAGPIWAGSITVEDAYARASTMGAVSGAAFMEIHNAAEVEDRLVAVRSDVAQRVELHTHISDANGVMQMVEVEEGFAIPAGGVHALARGGDHVMFMGLNRPLVQGEMIELTLTFEQAGEVVVQVPVDLNRKPDHALMLQKSGQN